MRWSQHFAEHQQSRQNWSTTLSRLLNLLIKRPFHTIVTTASGRNLLPRTDNFQNTGALLQHQIVDIALRIMLDSRTLLQHWACLIPITVSLAKRPIKYAGRSAASGWACRHHWHHSLAPSLWLVQTHWLFQLALVIAIVTSRLSRRYLLWACNAAPIFDRILQITRHNHRRTMLNRSSFHHWLGIDTQCHHQMFA